MTPQYACEVLKAPANADQATLARAFRAAVKACHPDREGGDAERLRQVIDAHRLLQQLQEARRAAFGESRTQPKQEAKAAPTPQPEPQPTVETLDISINEALFGGARRVRLASGRELEVRLPAGLELSVTSALEDRPDAHTGRIRFFPDGSSTGGHIVLRSGRRQWRINVSWLTGQVAVVDRVAAR